MQSEYIEIIKELPSRNEFGLPAGNWFTDAGITPSGRCWVSPSEDFYECWLFDDMLADYLAELGFEWGFDGAAVGSWSEFIFYCPSNMGQSDVFRKGV